MTPTDWLRAMARRQRRKPPATGGTIPGPGMHRAEDLLPLPGGGCVLPTGQPANLPPGTLVEVRPYLKGPLNTEALAAALRTATLAPLPATEPVPDPALMAELAERHVDEATDARLMADGPDCPRCTGRYSRCYCDS